MGSRLREIVKKERADSVFSFVFLRGGGLPAAGRDYLR